MSKESFREYSKYYDLLYLDKDYVSEAQYVFQTLSTFQPELKQLLELGMGTGIHANLLGKKGLEITGIELSDSMAAKAREKGLECYTGSCTNFSLNKKFDAAISLFHVISYLTTNDDLLGTFQNVNKHLNVNGIFLFDIWYTPAVYNLKPEVRIKRLTDQEASITRIAEPVMHWNNNVVDVNYEIFIENENNNTKIIEKHPMRHFSLPELHLLAEITGFEFIHSEEWLTRAIPSQNTWGVSCIFIKKNS